MIMRRLYFEISFPCLHTQLETRICLQTVYWEGEPCNRMRLGKEQKGGNRTREWYVHTQASAMGNGVWRWHPGNRAFYPPTCAANRFTPWLFAGKSPAARHRSLGEEATRGLSTKAVGDLQGGPSICRDSSWVLSVHRASTTRSLNISAFLWKFSHAWSICRQWVRPKEIVRVPQAST